MDAVMRGPSRGVTITEAVLAVGGSLLVHALALAAMMTLALPFGELPSSLDRPFITVNLVTAGGAPCDSPGAADRVGPGGSGGTEAAQAAHSSSGNRAAEPDVDTPAEPMHHTESPSGEAGEAKAAGSPAAGTTKDIQRVRRTVRGEKKPKKLPDPVEATPPANSRLPSTDLDKSTSSSFSRDPATRIPEMGGSTGVGGHGPEEGGGEVPAGSSGAASSPGASSGTGADLGRSDGAAPDAMPKIIERIEPVYPLKARLSAIRGKVVLKLLVGADGRVSTTSILEANPEGVFEQSVLEAIRRWRFKPANRRGAPVAAWVILTFQFEQKK